MSLLLLVAPFGAGVFSHIGFFNRGEHHLYGARYISIFSLILAALTALLYHNGHSLSEAGRAVSIASSTYLAGLSTSLLTYRLLLHPLNAFSGPLGLRVSNFYFSFKLPKGDAHRQLLHLHQRHGDFVRIGSSDLSITHPDAVTAIYGPTSRCTKSGWYDLQRPTKALNTERDRAAHDQRRRVWSAAFGERALRDYERRLQPYRNKLLAQFAATHGQPVNVSEWFKLYSYDAMADLAHSQTYGLLAGRDHWALRLVRRGARPLGWYFPPWLGPTVKALRPFRRPLNRLFASAAEERLRLKPETPDIFSAFLAPLQGREPTAEEFAWLQGDSSLMVNAGADTTATALTHMVFKLCQHPEHVQKLRAELEPLLPDPTAEVPHKDIAHLAHLNAVITETLRLHPPVPGALYRVTPPDGLRVGAVHVPGDMAVFCPQYVVGRKEEFYASAECFVPERWTTRPEMIRDKGTFAPFLMGPYGCIGRPLALLNLRVTLARLVLTFDFGFAPVGTDPVRAFTDGEMDCFVIVPPPLMICFKKREEGGT